MLMLMMTGVNICPSNATKYDDDHNDWRGLLEKHLKESACLVKGLSLKPDAIECFFPIDPSAIDGKRSPKTAMLSVQFLGLGPSTRVEFEELATELTNGFLLTMGRWQDLCLYIQTLDPHKSVLRTYQRSFFPQSDHQED